MAASVRVYEVWLTERLLQLNPDTDTDVFVSYITGILEEEVPKDEKRESLLDLIGQVVETNMEEVCEELLKKWDEISGSMEQEKDDESEKLTEHLASILEQQKIEVVKPKEKTAEEEARKQAILEQYQHVSSGDEDDDDSGGMEDPAGGGDLLDFKNTNAELVKKVEQEKREKSKQDSEKKKRKTNRNGRLKNRNKKTEKKMRKKNSKRRKEEIAFFA